MLLQNKSRDEFDIYRSRCNAGHEGIVRKKVSLMESSTRHASLTLLCFCSVTERVLEKMLKVRACEVYTVDQFQGQESQVVILVTTRDYEGE